MRVEIDAWGQAGVRNSQPEGIGRVASLDGLVAWNNLGRNVVFADRQLRPVAVFGSTMFPDQDEASQYDLDIHAVLAVPDQDLVVALNHLGWVRMFHRSDLVQPRPRLKVDPVATAAFVADMERTVVVGSRLVGTRPRAGGAIGLAVSPPLEEAVGGALLEIEVVGEDLGEVTALGSLQSAGAPDLIVGGPGYVAMVAFTGAQVGAPRWRVGLPFRAAVIEWDGRLVWLAGPATSAVDDYDWERLGGGGFVALDPEDGATVMAGPLPEDVAWGTGGVAVLRAGGSLCAVGRTGALHLLDITALSSWRSTPALAPRSLGIAHAAAVGGKILYGFNRGGYRLWASTGESDSSAGGAGEDAP